jgi:hypothetical protein
MPRNLLLVLGTIKWLDFNKDIHNGNGGKVFIEQLKLIEDGAFVNGSKVTKSSAARLFDVHRHTFQSWIDNYNKVDAKDDDRRDV